jgi:hypothetical protein
MIRTTHLSSECRRAKVKRVGEGTRAGRRRKIEAGPSLANLDLRLLLLLNLSHHLSLHLLRLDCLIRILKSVYVFKCWQFTCCILMTSSCNICIWRA